MEDVKISNGVRKVTLKCGPGKTKQSEKDSCDINRIIKTFQRTGRLPDGVTRNAVFADVSGAPDFMEAMEIVQRGQFQFELLPATVRKKFDNDPACFLAAFNDPANDAYFREMGFLTPEAKKEDKSAQDGKAVAS